MLPVGPKPILEHIIDWLKKNGIREIVISTGYLGKMIQQYFEDGSEWGVKITYAVSPAPLGTAGQLKAAESKLRGRFVLVYGDALLDFDLKKATSFHEKKGATATMVLMKYSTETKYGFMETDDEGRLTAWKEKPRLSGYINVGCYVMEKSFLKFIPPRVMYGMRETFDTAMTKSARVYAVRVDGEFIDIGDREAYRNANDVFVKKLGKVV